MSLHRFLVSWICVFSGSDLFLVEGSSQACKSPQYVELGRTATISCNFEGRFYGVFWFNTTNITSSERPFIIITESEKSGRGFTSGEFDIEDDGSLIIKTVSLRHDISFAVNVLYTSDGDANIENVRVIVYAEPEQPYPVIDGCDRNVICYQTSNMEYTVTCSVQDSRPPANLTMLLKTPKGDFSISSNKTVFPTGTLYTSRLQATITFNGTNRLLVLYCRGGILPHTSNEAMIIIEKNQSGRPPVGLHERLNVGVGSEVTMNCGEHNASYFVWRKKGEENVIAIGLGSVYGNVTDMYSNEFQLTGHNNILVISSFEKKHNGTYICVYGDGITTATRVFEVTTDDTQRANPALIVIIVVVILLILCSIVAVVVLFKKAKRKESRPKSKINKTESQPMLPKNPTSKALKEYLSSNDVSFKWDESQKKKYDEDHDKYIKWLTQASKEGMEVRCVRLLNCFVSVDNTADHIGLASERSVPVIKSLKSLFLHQTKITLVKMEDFEKLVQYATKCSKLRTLQFSGFCLPFIDKNCGSLCDKIQKSTFNVEWVSQTPTGTLRINSQERCWKKTEGSLSEKSYEELIKQIMRLETESLETSARHV